jgi:hypothetical protein
LSGPAGFTSKKKDRVPQFPLTEVHAWRRRTYGRSKRSTGNVMLSALTRSNGLNVPSREDVRPGERVEFLPMQAHFSWVERQSRH